ncbi:MAG: bacillithiol biosynthesis deacetylase BshB1 [Holophagaceae bacterium]|nr:bacillithiol biosynthesis deacetylase BshB1 [Holophagaceae bacterium]
MSANLDVLAVGAHPDDVEVHVGGLLALASRRGLKAGILDLTGGELGTRGDAATRRAEALRAAAILGVPRTLLDLPDGRFDEGEGHRAKVMAVLRELRPEVLILPSPEDRHPDHRRAHRLVSEAAFCAGLRNYPDPAAPGRPFPGEPWRPAAIAWVGGENPGPPDLVVDVSEVWATRMEAFDAFGSQFTADPAQALTRIAHPAFRRGVEGRAMHWGSLITVDAAEALWCAKPVSQALLRLLERLR